MLQEPRVLDDVISVTAAMRPNCRSSGVATDDAMVSGLAPGSDALTEIVGTSTCGKGETGRIRNAPRINRAIATVSSVVATGLWTKGAEIFISTYRKGRPLVAQASAWPACSAPEEPGSPARAKSGPRRVSAPQTGSVCATRRVRTCVGVCASCRHSAGSGSMPLCPSSS